MTDSRTYNVAKNATLSLICQAVAILLSFVNRTVFIYTLGKDYLGISGLFTNILAILSFTELGIGNAIIFSMYKPLATRDTEKLKSLMALYKRAYQVIGVVVAICGVLVIPFMDMIIPNKPDIAEHLTIIYLLYLANSVSSYFFVYRKSIIIADQKLYLVSIYQQVTGIVQLGVQAVLLFLTRDFILYLGLQILFTIINNVVITIKAGKLFPFLKEKAQPLPKDERKGIFRNIRALTVYKFASVILNGTDNIIVSIMFNVGYVGLISNYLLLTTAFSTILGKITESFTSSVGNLNTKSDSEKQYSVFNKMFFLGAWMFGFAAVGLLLLANDAVALWIGNDYLLPFSVVLALVLHFYINSVHYAAHTYRVTLGLFVEGQSAPAIAAILNIVLSITLAKSMGLSGVFFATSISRFLTTGLVDPILVYRRTFHKNPAIYFVRYFAFVGLYVALYFALRLILSYIFIAGIGGFILKCAIITVLFNGTMLLIFGQTQILKEISQAGTSVLHGRKKKCA